MLEINGSKDNKKYLPHCLGHEASGYVVEIGEDVSNVKVGDKVVLTWIKNCGIEAGGSVFEYDNHKINAGPITTFSEYTIVSENRLYVLTKDISMQEASLLGCVIPTGLGAVLNVAKPKNNQSIVIFGCGGIGLLAIQAAKISGCNPIIAIDLFENKLEEAKRCGATHGINAKNYSNEKIQEICKEIDFAIEASGNSKAMLNALDVVRPFSGKAIIVGNIHYDQTIEINPKHFNMGKSLIGTWGGNSKPFEHYGIYEELIFNKQLDMSIFLKNIFNIHDINKAIDEFMSGKINRVLIKFN